MTQYLRKISPDLNHLGISLMRDTADDTCPVKFILGDYFTWLTANNVHALRKALKKALPRHLRDRPDTAG